MDPELKRRPLSYRPPLAQSSIAVQRSSHAPARLYIDHAMPTTPSAILSDATSGFRNGLRRMASGNLVDRPRAKGKENRPPFILNDGTPSPTFATGFDPNRWDPVDGRIVIKVAVPSTDDIWRFKVPHNVSLRGFRAKVELKIGFAVTFAESDAPQARRVASEEAFRRWVANRVKDGRNTPLTALRKQYPNSSYPPTPTSPLSPQLPPSPLSPHSPFTPFQQSPFRHPRML